MSIDYTKARRTLARRDPVMRDLMRRHGACGLADAQHEDPFRALVHAIIAQQLSSKAAATIEGRFDALFAGGRPKPADVAAVPDERLRAVGMSFQKIRYVRDLCARIQDGSLDLHAFHDMSDDAVVSLTHQQPSVMAFNADAVGPQMPDDAVAVGPLWNVGRWRWK